MKLGPDGKRVERTDFPNGAMDPDYIIATAKGPDIDGGGF